MDISVLQTMEGFDYDGALERLAGSEDLYAMVLEQFSTDFAEWSVEAASAEGEDLYKLAHRLSGAAANVGADSLRALAMNLQSAVRGGASGEAEREAVSRDLEALLAVIA